MIQNIKLNRLAILLFMVLFGASCEEKFTTDLGIEVTKVRKGNGDSCVENNLILCNVRYELDDGRLLMESPPNEPVPIFYDIKQRELNFLVGVVDNMSLGDSVVFEIDAEMFWVKTLRQAIPDTVDPGARIKFYMGASDQMTREQYVQKRNETNSIKEVEMKQAQAETINQFLKDKGIVAKESESGLRYVVNQSTSGDNPKSGDKVKVHYTGMLLDGTVFDSSVGKGEPLEFQIGIGQVIKGWDEGISYLKVGEKGVLYVPSHLGYGSRGAGSVIPPDAILMFEVELIAIN